MARPKNKPAETANSPATSKGKQPQAKPILKVSIDPNGNILIAQYDDVSEAEYVLALSKLIQKAVVTLPEKPPENPLAVYLPC